MIIILIGITKNVTKRFFLFKSYNHYISYSVVFHIVNNFTGLTKAVNLMLFTLIKHIKVQSTFLVKVSFKLY